MRLIINGLERDIPEPVTLRQLIAAEGDTVDAVLVEVNGALVSRRDYDSHSLAEGDRVEIIQPAFGG
jgi:sulfur carrier protein